ncbi:tyrosine-tRNA ligase [Pandoravirus japonicus]|uniref:tyrosine--tRNA ligase n=1 Tax=Pandoravirus japonicus TaxID=2823154 RepID=A0A811BPZ7_9VIRU|nr:tyrosine-tRNA ligase [Pandoravirus japonicus]
MIDDDDDGGKETAHLPTDDGALDQDDVEQRYALVVRDLDEVIGEPAEIKAIMAERPLAVYWGTAPTGNPHLGYFVPIFKLADFLQAGCRVKILFADVHAHLDNAKTPWDLVEHRCRWYEFAIKAMLQHIGVPLDRLEFVRGSDYQHGTAYTLDLLRLTARVTVATAQKAAAQVVKMERNPLLSNVIYPLMQALDEEHLDVDAQFGGRDQRKIFAFARDHLPALGYRKRVHLLNPLVPGLTKSGKMSASEAASKIGLDDPDEVIRAKIRQAYSVDGCAEGNGLLAILRFVLWRWLEPAGLPFVVTRPPEYGGPQTFATYAEVEAAFVRAGVPPAEGDGERLFSVDLKPAVADLLCEFLAPLRGVLAARADLLHAAYPPPS